MDIRSAVIATLAGLAAPVLSYLDAKFFDKKRTNITYMKSVVCVWVLVYAALEWVPYEFLRDTGFQFLSSLEEPIMTGGM